ncbi:uncharacterized protein L199_004461 [Kwoniella botswanensis]|uniref:uncharacterized protein n=1 Tax=Kwoniella botswanensis TaxID=1268659 RepID=UPI00315CDE37
MPSPSPYPSSYPHRHLALTNLLQEQPAGFSTGNDRYQLFNTDLHSQHQRSVALDSILLGGWATSKGRDQDLLHHVDSLRINKNDFQVIGRLGDGQFGTVDAVECKLNGQVYAMKTMPKQAIKRAGIQVCLELERHIHILSHVFPAAPVPTLFVAFQSKDSISLVTEYAACGSLWDRLCSLSDEDDQAGCMTVAEIKWWSPQMVAAIQWMHDQGYVHRARDIKPHNFLITDGGRLKLTDFGSSAELSRPRVPSERPFVPHDLCCLPIGTPDYIAPEVLLCAEEAFVQAAGANEASYSPPTFGYDLSIDWWSFGATVFEMATGKGPFWAPTIQQTYFEITQYKGDLQCPLKLDEGLRRLLQRYVRAI